MERSSFFNSVGGDRKYFAEDMARHFAKVLTNGVFPTGTQLQVTPADGLAVSLSAGSAWINGYAYTNDGDLTLPLAVADGVLQRIDRVVIRWDRSERKITTKVITGVPASLPTAPDITRDADCYDLGIALVLVSAGATLITQELISDTRADNEVCGFVSSLITPDTSGWWDQFNAAFYAWFAGIQNALDGDTAGNLLNLINAHIADTNDPHDVTPAQIGAATPATDFSVTLSTAWTGSSAPFTQTVTVTGLTGTRKIFVGVADNATDDQEAAAEAAKLKCTGKAANQITVKARGTKPTIAIPIIVREVD